ncbi:MAG: trypsin-like peptidase domain-containing protein [Deltaproteobacteria bacterium]|nr:trypsin-like peptidase domain-containing protein [Deltaproteobacteria bacterium]
MFETAVTGNREAIYAILGSSPPPKNALTPSLGSAFMVAPGLLVTAARIVRDDSRPDNPPLAGLRVIRAPDIGKRAEPVTVVAANAREDLALLRIDSPRSTTCLRLLDAPVPVGTHCGTAGFPRITVDPEPSSGISLIELFQGADISSFVNSTGADGHAEYRYETDAPLYGDASGSPGFLASGEVFGMVHLPDGPPPAGVTFWVPSMAIVAFLKANGVQL